MGADRVVTDFAQRGPDQRTTPVVGHHDQDARRKASAVILEVLSSSTQRGIPRVIFSAFP
jgi:hypothetical protein